VLVLSVHWWPAPASVGRVKEKRGGDGAIARVVRSKMQDNCLHQYVVPLSPMHI